MQPTPVRYVSTHDGVRIAYTVSGSGPPLVLFNEPTTSHVELEWSQPVLGEMLRQLMSRTTLVRLDVRATGLSDRVKTPGDDAVLGDLRAVVGHLGLKRYALVAVHSLSPAAIVYASRYPDEVTHLALIDPALRVLEIVTSPQLTAIMTAARADWTIATEAIGMLLFGVGRAESRAFGGYIRSCIDPDFYSIALRATEILDATGCGAIGQSAYPRRSPRGTPVHHRRSREGGNRSDSRCQPSHSSRALRG